MTRPRGWLKGLSVLLILAVAFPAASNVVNFNPTRFGGSSSGLTFAGASGGTATRVLFTDGSGNLADDADLTFATDTLTVTKIASTTFTGTNLATGRITFGTAADALGAVDLNETAGQITWEGAAADTAEHRLGATVNAGFDTLTTIPALAVSQTVMLLEGTQTVAGAKTFPAGTSSVMGLASGGAGYGIWTDTTGVFLRVAVNTNSFFGSSSANGFEVAGGSGINFCTAANLNAGACTADLIMAREGAAIAQLGIDANSASAIAQTLKALDGITGTDRPGGNLTISGGRGTGAGAGGNTTIQSSPALGTGSTAQTLADRIVVVAKPKALTAANATSVVLFALASSTVGGGEIEYTVTANDSTDFQIRAGRVGYVMVNKAGTETCKVFGIDSVLGVAGTENPNQTQDASGIGAMSSGTLTYTWGTDVTGTNTCALTLNAASSLAETTLEIAYTVYRQHGTGAITPQ